MLPSRIILPALGVDTKQYPCICGDTSENLSTVQLTAGVAHEPGEQSRASPYAGAEQAH